MSKIEIPDFWNGKPIRGSLDRMLDGSKQVKNKKEQKPVEPAKETRDFKPSTNISDPENWVILEGRKNGTVQYSDLVVCMHRLGMSLEVERAAQALGYNLHNTSNEKDGTPYIGDIDWTQAISLNDTLGNRTLTPRQGIDLLIDLRAAIPGRKAKNLKVLYDGNAQPIDPDRLKAFYEEMIKVRDPWRGEWLDAKFSQQGNGLHIEHSHQLNKGLFPRNNTVLQAYMAENGYMDLDSANIDGLGTKESRIQTLYLYRPQDGKVARFYADSVRAVLVCGEDPSGRDSRLGVRAVREKN